MALVKYIANGKEYTGQIASPSVTIGSKIPIRYDPKQQNPSAFLDDSSSYTWLWLLLIAIICFVISYVSYYQASHKSMEKYLAAEGALDAARTINDIFIKKGGYYYFR